MVNVVMGDSLPMVEISTIPISSHEMSQLVTSLCVQSFLKGVTILR